jgi:hypothetical protein
MGDSELTAAPIELITPAYGQPMDEVVQKAYRSNDIAQQLIEAVQDPTVDKWPKALRKHMRVPMVDCSVKEGKLYFRHRMYAPQEDELRAQILYRHHSAGPAGHPGRVKTLDLITRTWWWPRMSRDVEAYVQACGLFVRTKASRLSPQGFLQPLPLPYKAWSDISVDYITPLPESNWYGRSYKHLLIVVCRLTKMRHLIPVTGLTAAELADAFVARVYCLHGCPDNIVSDRGTQFISQFWTQLSQRLGITLKHSSLFRPETDGQTERINSSVEAYLRAFMNFHQNDWVQWLPLAEFALNNVISETTGVSPFFANYGFNPCLGTEPSEPPHPDMSAAQKTGFYKANAVANRFEVILTQLKALAQQSIDKYEHYANLQHEDAPRYKVGQLVWLDARNLKTVRPMKKGEEKVIGPFKITKTYSRACLLELPAEMKIFPVFYHSLLRPHSNSLGLPGQHQINKSKNILDCHKNKNGLNYQIAWRHHKPTWQLAKDLKDNVKAVRKFHTANPTKPSLPNWGQ